MPVDDAAGNGRLRGIALGRAQLHDVVRRHLVRRQRDSRQRSSALHTHAPSASISPVCIRIIACLHHNLAHHAMYLHWLILIRDSCTLHKPPGASQEVWRGGSTRRCLKTKLPDLVGNEGEQHAPQETALSILHAQIQQRAPARLRRLGPALPNALLRLRHTTIIKQTAGLPSIITIACGHLNWRQCISFTEYTLHEISIVGAGMQAYWCFYQCSLPRTHTSGGFFSPELPRLRAPAPAAAAYAPHTPQQSAPLRLAAEHPSAAGARL